MFFKKYLMVLCIFFGFASLNGYKIGLCVVATGKYIKYVKPLIDSAQKYFCPQDEITYFIFTDGEPPQYPNVIKFYHPRQGWPFDTLMRSVMYFTHVDDLAKMDYIFACDADMLFVDLVGREILADRVATQHPGFLWQRGSYETRPTSKAYVAPDEGKYYFAGGFYGGTSREFLKLTQTLVSNIYADLGNKIVAVWHDESHLNRYFIDHEPTRILSPEYCYPESWNLPYHKRLLALDKNHGEMRE